MPEQKYMYHISENWFGKRFNQQYIKDTLRVPLGNRADDINHYKKYEDKWKDELKSLSK